MAPATHVLFTSTWGWGQINLCVLFILSFRCKMSEEDSEMDTENIVEDVATQIGVNLD